MFGKLFRVLDVNLVQLSYLLLLCLHMTRRVFSQTNDKSIENLYKRIFVDHNAKLRPLRNQTQVFYLDIFLHISSIIDISEVDQKVAINGWVNLSWIDQLRVWNSSEFDGFDMFFPEPGVSWSPRLLLTNSVAKIDVFEDEHTYHFIFANGTTRFYPSGVFQVACNMKMSYFPFDTQRCYLRILTKYLASYVKFRVPEKADDNAAISAFRSHGEWAISEVRQTASDEVFDNEVYSVYIVYFSLTRKPTFVVLVVVLPVILLSMISLLVFLLPVESGEKVSFSITVLLSLSVFTSFVSDLLPRNSQSLPMLVIYLFALMVLTGLAVVTTILMMASNTDGQLDVINNTMNNNSVAVDNEERANEIRSLRGTNLNGHVSENGNLATSRTDFRSSSRRNSNHAKTNSHGRPHGNHTTASHINQWRSNDENGLCFPDTVEESHSVLHDTVNVNAGLYYDTMDTFPRRRASNRSLGGVLDHFYSTKRHSLCKLNYNHHGSNSPNLRGYFSAFLNRIPRRDKYFAGVFFVIWLFLTVGFMTYTALA